MTNSRGDITLLLNSELLSYSLSKSRLKFRRRLVNKIAETVRSKTEDFKTRISYIEANLQRLR